MIWGDRAAEQYEKDQPSTYNAGALSALVDFQNFLDGLPPVEPRETPAETVLDADERRGD